MTDTDTVEAAALRRREREAQSVEVRVNAAQKWFGTIGASHVNPAAFVQLSLAQLDKVKRLREAAEDNPESFLSAMAECARLGLMPGDTYYYLPFYNTKAPNPRRPNNAQGRWEIVGVIYWTGEVELMYRGGEVDAVIVQEVREHDEFAWNPSTMAVPHHVIAANDTGQIGLADKTDRGKLTGVYCYVRFHGGGTSFPTVMRPSEVAEHRAASKTQGSFWGPEWPLEGQYTVDMWRKTAVHKHASSVPTSPEYRASVMRATAATLTPPAEVGAIGGPVSDMIEPPSAGALPAGNGGGPSPTTIQGRAEDARDHKPATKAENLDRLRGLFRQAGIGGEEWLPVQLALLGMLAVEVGGDAISVTKPNALSAPQLATAVANLTDVIARAEAQDRHPSIPLLVAAIHAHAWDGSNPPPPEGYDQPTNQHEEENAS